MPTQNFFVVDSVADFDYEELDGNSLVEILTLKIFQDIEAEVWSRF